MKRLVVVSVLVLAAVINFSWQQVQPAMVKFTFKNNSVLPHSFTIVTYAPGEKGNGTVGVMLLPYKTLKQEYAEGTKVYFASNDEKELVMSGKTLTGTPFLTVSKSDEGKTILLNK